MSKFNASSKPVRLATFAYTADKTAPTNRKAMVAIQAAQGGGRLMTPKEFMAMAKK